MPVIGGLLAWFGALAARFFTASVLRYIAIKTVLFVLTTVILPIVLNNFLHSIISGAQTLISEYASSQGVSAQVVQLSGLAGWLAVKLKVPESLALVMSALAFRVSLRMIPFLRLG